MQGTKKEVEKSNHYELNELMVLHDMWGMEFEINDGAIAGIIKTQIA